MNREGRYSWTLRPSRFCLTLFTGFTKMTVKHLQARLRAEDEWLQEHLEGLVAQYAGRVVAIQQGRIVAVGNTEAEVYQEVRRRKLKPMPLVFRVPREEDLQALLLSPNGSSSDSSRRREADCVRV